MARKQPRFEQVYLQHSLDRWFTNRQRVFVYHYVSQPEIDPLWQDLTTTGCRYHGWAVLGDFHRGEIWTYPSRKHLTMVQMLVTRDQLITPQDWTCMKKERRDRDLKYRKQIRALIKKHGSTYTWWGQEK